MTFTKLSLLVPTRQRVARLDRFLRSYDATTHMLVKGVAELVFRADDDDAETQERLAHTPWKTVVGPRLAGYRSLPVFFNEMLSACTGDVVMCGNDDLVCQTPAWPARVLEAANRYPDGLFDLGVATLNQDHFPFSIISRWAAETMGFVHDPRVFWGDLFLRDVMGAFGRAVLVPHVRIDHDWAGHAPDDVFRDARQDEGRNWDAAYWALHHAAVSASAEKLRLATGVPA